ncbi:MAG: FAD-dependent oxidoreductase [Phycisphaerae bacterium]|nr:FAD-dependent oxidoreductase [Phycisphaerae bacterium]
MNRLLIATGCVAMLAAGCAGTATTTQTFDVVIYGGTSAGVAAAVQSGRMGKSVALVEPGRHLGGLTSGGLGATDTGKKEAIGGLSREFYRRLGEHYGQPEMWTFEPHVAEQLMDAMARESGAAVFRQHRLRSVAMQGTRITAITTSGGLTLRGRMFIDATYEGDLLAKAGVSYTVGREANATYNETLNGVQLGQPYHQFDVPVDPYVIEGDPASGLLARIHPDGPGEHGQGDHRVQAYCFRMCLTKDPANRIPFPKPAGYDAEQYALLARYLQNAEAAGKDVRRFNHKMMPNGKTDTNNNGAFSTDNIGMNYDWPDGDEATRTRIFAEHETYQKGLMWFLCNDPRVPERVRKETSGWGLCKDEFVETGGWPHQLYIREGRRMVSDYVVTEHDCMHRVVPEDSVRLGSYNMDSHNVQRYARDGVVLNEGDVQVPPQGPYPITYRSIVPKAAECTNLLVPVCLSCSHIAYGSIRMEPVFMILGQSAATAACQAIDGDTSVQEVDYATLRERLLADGQVLTWAGPIRKGIDARGLSGHVVDDAQARITGAWHRSANAPGFVGSVYLHDANSEKGEKSVRFPLSIPSAGRYRIRMAYAENPNRATNVPVTIHHADGDTAVTVNQRKSSPEPDGLLTLGTFRFNAGNEAYVEISNRATNGHVIADAVQYVPVE